MIRVVVDVGVVISAMIAPGGTPARVFDLWMDGGFDLVVSPAWLGELAEVAARPRIATRMTRSQTTRLASAIVNGAVVIADPAPVAGLTPDPDDDDDLVALARAAGARYLVSGDAHLLGIHEPRPPVITARRLLELLA